MTSGTDNVQQRTNWPGKHTGNASRDVPAPHDDDSHKAKEQHRSDDAEKQKHPRSENALDSTQEKNPVPAGSTRR